jgi:hypothetical protein
MSALREVELLPSTRGKQLTHAGDGRRRALCGATVAAVHTVWLDPARAADQITCRRCLAALRRRAGPKEG